MPGLSMFAAAAMATAAPQPTEEVRVKLESLAATLNRAVGQIGDENSELRFIGAEPGYNSISVIFQTQGEFTGQIFAAFNGLSARSIGLCENPEFGDWMMRNKVDVQIIFFAGSASRMERKITLEGCRNTSAAAVGPDALSQPQTLQQTRAAQPTQANNSGSSREAVWRDAVVRHLQSSLIDPESARITAPFGFTPQLTTWKIWGVNETGYFTCGTVNSRNRFGGYVGSAVFVGIIRADGRVETTIDSDKYPILSKLCAAANLPRLQG